LLAIVAMNCALDDTYRATHARDVQVA